MRGRRRAPRFFVRRNPRGGAEPLHFLADFRAEFRLHAREVRGAGGMPWHEHVATQNRDLRDDEVHRVLRLCPGTWRKWCENLASLDVTNRAAMDAAPVRIARCVPIRSRRSEPARRLLGGVHESRTRSADPRRRVARLAALRRSCANRAVESGIPPSYRDRGSSAPSISVSAEPCCSTQRANRFEA